MGSVSLEYFGEFLMQRVRDMSISHWEKIIDGRMKSADAQEMHKKIIATATDVDLFEEIVRRVVDTTLHNLLWGLEEEVNVDVVIQRNELKESIKEISDGLAGELYTADGWIARYSQKSK